MKTSPRNAIVGSMKPLIILGSSRRHGDTGRIVDELIGLTNWDLVDLTEYKIGYYDYEHRNLDDDFLGLIRRIIRNYDVIVFATPVYWYSMSGHLKVFFDRITDLLDNDKDLGRKLRGKSMAALSCSGGSNLGDVFWEPFRASADYLGMKFFGGLHTYPNRDESVNLRKFAARIERGIEIPYES